MTSSHQDSDSLIYSYIYYCYDCGGYFRSSNNNDKFCPSCSSNDYRWITHYCNKLRLGEYGYEMEDENY